MSLGLGVFLGLVFCGLIYFQVSTGKNVFKWIGLIVVGACALLFAWIQIDQYLDSRVKVVTEPTDVKPRESLPEIITALGGIKLGEPFADVEFRFGKFKKRASSDLYESHRFIIQVVVEKVATIIYKCGIIDSMSVCGIRCGESGEDIVQKFGNKVSVSQAGDTHLQRFYYVKDWRVTYFLMQNEVKWFAIKESKKYQGKN